MEWFLKCIKEHYFDSSERARHEEYWMSTLVDIIISVAPNIVFGLINKKFLLIVNLYSLVVLLPALGVIARCPHDINKSGRWMLTTLTLIVGLHLTYLLVKDSNAGQNQYGRNPEGVARSLPIGSYGSVFSLSLLPFPPLTGVRILYSYPGALR